MTWCHHPVIINDARILKIRHFLPERNDPKLELLPGRGLKIITLVILWWSIISYKPSSGWWQVSILSSLSSWSLISQLNILCWSLILAQDHCSTHQQQSLPQQHDQWPTSAAQVRVVQLRLLQSVQCCLSTGESFPLLTHNTMGHSITDHLSSTIIERVNIYVLFCFRCSFLTMLTVTVSCLQDDDGRCWRCDSQHSTVKFLQLGPPPLITAPEQSWSLVSGWSMVASSVSPVLTLTCVTVSMHLVSIFNSWYITVTHIMLIIICDCSQLILKIIFSSENVGSPHLRKKFKYFPWFDSNFAAALLLLFLQHI